MIANELIDHISTVTFLGEVVGGEAVGGVPLHEEDLAADHGDELRTDHVHTALKHLVGMQVAALLTLPLSTMWSK